MRVLIPSFYKNFKCIADKCTDSCCVGWEIDIDPDTHEYYKSVGGEFGERLKKDIETNGDVHFRLKDERCAFLNGRNLCDIFTNCGEEHLCEICAEHPRFHEWFGDYKESGLGLCCEEACRLLFSSSDPLEFEEIETDEEPDNREFDEELFSTLREDRKEIFKILQDRTLSIEERLRSAVTYSDSLQYYIDAGKIQPIDIEQLIRDEIVYKRTRNPEEYFKYLIWLLNGLEPISPDYPEYLKNLEDRLPEILNSFDYYCDYFKSRSHEYENLAVYTVYRYFMKAVFDSDAAGKIGFAQTFVAAVFLFDCYTLLTTGKYTMTDRINNVKMFSKEVEYCEENLELMML